MTPILAALLAAAVFQGAAWLDRYEARLDRALTERRAKGPCASGPSPWTAEASPLPACGLGRAVPRSVSAGADGARRVVARAPGSSSQAGREREPAGDPGSAPGSASVVYDREADVA